MCCDGDVAREDAPLASLEAEEEAEEDVDVDVAVEKAEDGVGGAVAAGDEAESRPSRGDWNSIEDDFFKKKFLNNHLEGIFAPVEVALA